jgi:hypothetical protein
MIDAGAGARARTMVNDRQRLAGHTIFSFIMLNLWLEECYDRINR